METKYPKYNNNTIRSVARKKNIYPREDYKMLQNYYLLLDFPMRDNNRRGRDTQHGGTRKRMKRMKNNVNMRKHHRIQQPGHDVQRVGGK
jgi:hypothetical protein